MSAKPLTAALRIPMHPSQVSEWWRAQGELGLMTQRQQPVFALIRANEPVMAFEVENADAAKRLAQAPWFMQSLNRIYAKQRGDGKYGFPWIVRAATDVEATLYRSRLAEFAEEVNQLLVVNVSVS
jgi:hypothetical protein